MPVDVQGLALKASGTTPAHIEFTFDNNDHNVQLLLPIRFNITCTGGPCLWKPKPVQPGDITVTPWCHNSARVQIEPSQVSSSVHAARAALSRHLKGMGKSSLPGALVETCKPGQPVVAKVGEPVKFENIVIETKWTIHGIDSIDVRRVDTGALLFTASVQFAESMVNASYLSAQLSLKPGDTSEQIYGLGQGKWTREGGCPSGEQRVVPLKRNGQEVNLQQRKFHVSIPFAYSTAGYGFLFNMGGYGSVKVGEDGVGGMTWRADAALGLDFWVSALPSGVPTTAPAPIYEQYADATGHAPMLREDAMIFWQSRNRYKSSAIALDVAEHYRKLDLPVGVLVIDYKNQVRDGDFAPNPACFPSVSALSDGIREKLNATTMFSFWPEVKEGSGEYDVLKQQGCLINSALGGLVWDATIPACRDFVWQNFLKPRYFDEGVTSYWLDETDGEGTGGGGDGDHGYDTSYGPAAFASNLWVNDYLAAFSEPVRNIGDEEPLVLTRGVWAGGQRHGVVLWSSDVWSSFEQLASQVPQGVHASLSGIPWWTTDVGGYGCGFSKPNDSPYMQELIVRWYQFGLFSPVFRTHGCRSGPSEPDTDQCRPAQGSCGFNEVWSYGDDTQAILERYVRMRMKLKPYIQELAVNVTARGVPTMRPLWWEFPEDRNTVGLDDQYMLGPEFLVAPVTVQGATNRSVYFPKGASWKHEFDGSVVEGGQTLTIDGPLYSFPVYRRVQSSVISV